MKDERSSSLGIVCFTGGATLVFQVKNFRCVSSGVFILKYTTAAYALTGAPQKPSRLTDATSPWKPEKKHLGAMTGSDFLRSFNRLFQNPF